MKQKLESLLGLSLQNISLYEQAFTHKSFLNENANARSNERLEFLGDAVLELAITKFLYQEYPEKPEGELTSYRSALVQGKHLAEVAKDLQLGEFLTLSRGEEKSGGREKNYILANTFEAVLGAIYLDLGFQIAENFILSYVAPRLTDLVEQGLHKDAKSQFQEYTQETMGITPHYDLITAKGPDHEKEFIMAAFLEEKQVAQGSGSSKQKAELEAAKNALKKYENEISSCENQNKPKC